MTKERISELTDMSMKVSELKEKRRKNEKNRAESPKTELQKVRHTCNRNIKGWGKRKEQKKYLK